MLKKRSPIMYLLPQLPSDVTARELRLFVESGLNQGKRLSLKHSVADCSILRVVDPSSGAAEYHGMVEVNPDKDVLDAIDLLNGLEIRGQKIEVRRYRNRTTSGGGISSACTLGCGEAPHTAATSGLKIELVQA